MSKRLTIALGLTLSGVVLAVALALATFLMFKAPTPVSAQEIIERAMAANSTQQDQPGIQHRQIEQYQNFRGLTSATAEGVTTRTEDFLDTQTSRYRVVTTNADTGQVVDASGFDGTYLYASQLSETGAGTSSPLTVYKSPAPDGWVKNYGYVQGSPIDEKAIFEQLSTDVNVEYMGQETWVDGRSVYVIRSQQDMSKFLMMAGEKPDGAQALKGHNTIYFDAQTYQMVETKISGEVNGKEVVLTDFKLLVEEILPASTLIAWDLSDITGISLVDDPQGEHSGPWLENVTIEELASSGQKAYKLQPVPEGFSEDVVASEPGAQDQFYRITYGNASGDYIIIQIYSNSRNMLSLATEVHKTASGLTLYLMASDVPPAVMGKPDLFAIVETADGTLVDVTSNLPLERLMQLAEDLMPVE